MKKIIHLTRRDLLPAVENKRYLDINVWDFKPRPGRDSFREDIHKAEEIYFNSFGVAKCLKHR